MIPTPIHHKNTNSTLMEPSSSMSSKTEGGIIMGVLILFLYTLFRALSSKQKKPQAPVADGAWPVIGHLHLLAGTQPPHKTLAKMADKHGPIFTLRLGTNKAVVVSNWEIAKQCFTTNDKTFSSRPKLVATKHMGYNNSMFGLAQSGPFWRHIRKIVSLELLSPPRLEEFQPIRRSEVRIAIGKLYGLRRVEMKRWFEDITLNIMFRVVVGKRFSDDDDDDDDCRKAFRNVIDLFGVFVPSDSFWFLSWFDLGGYEKGMKEASKVLDLVLDKCIKEHRFRKMGIQKDEDFMDALINAIDKDDEQLSDYHGDSVIKATCLAMILAGFDTTASTMTWALSLLLNNPQTLKKAQLELEEQVGRQRQVTESDIKNLTYLQAIVKETLRLYPAAPLSIPHESIEDCTVSGYYISARTRLIVNLQKLQRDPLVWEEPNEFRPERFLTSHKDIDVRGQNPQLIPFGNGRRICLGISFSLQIMHLTLANLVHGFEIDRPSNELIDMNENFGLVSVKMTPLEVVLTPRLPTHVYT